MSRRIEFIDQTIRDGQQSLWGMRMQAGMALPVAREIDRAGFRRVDFAGSSMFEVLVRYCRENPWEGLDALKGAMPNSRFRGGCRVNGIVTFAITPRSIIELWVRTLVRHGISSFWIVDCLFDVNEMKWFGKMVQDAGAEAVPALLYCDSPVHTDSYYVDVLSGVMEGFRPDAVLVYDASGVLTPERSRSLVQALKPLCSDIPMEMLSHNVTGLAPLNYIEGIKEGISIIHTASKPLANGPSIPSTEGMLDNLRRLGYEVDLDELALEAIRRHFEWVAEREGFSVGVPNEYSVFPYMHQLPGGMTGTLEAQLAQYGMSDRLGEVLEEMPRIHAELGYPVMATPFSQLVGIQAVMNIVNRERYSVVPDEVIMYALGMYGEPPAKIDEDVLDSILGRARAREFEEWTPPQPSLREVREKYRKNISDEELLLRELIADEDVDEVLNGGPLERDYPERLEDPVWSVCELLRKSKSGFMHVASPDFELVSRREPRE